VLVEEHRCTPGPGIFCADRLRVQGKRVLVEEKA